MLPALDETTQSFRAILGRLGEIIRLCQELVTDLKTTNNSPEQIASRCERRHTRQEREMALLCTASEAQLSNKAALLGVLQRLA